MYQKQIEFIAKYVAYARERKEKLLIVLVMNVKPRIISNYLAF